MKKKIAIIFAVIIFLASTLYIVITDPDYRGAVNKKINEYQGKTLNEKFGTKIKSGNLATDYDIEKALSDIDKFNLNTLNIPVVINIENLNSSTMSIDEGSKKRAIQLIKRLKGKKINVILEPYPWIDNGSKVETDWNPSDKDEFFSNWTNNVLKVLIDDIAVPYHVDALIVGSSLTHTEAEEQSWCDTIDYVRKYYKGLVTYRTSWWVTAKWKPELTINYEKKLNNSLFSKLDFISIAAYFELTNNDVNSVENLVKAIESTQIYDRKQNVKKEIKNFYDKWNKPIFFGELGFPRTIKASISPWNPYQSTIINNLEQANCFEAYRREFENEPWHLGFSIFAIGEDSDGKWYYPSEESVAIIKKWYSKESSQ